MHGSEHGHRGRDAVRDDVVATVAGSLAGTFTLVATAWLAVVGFTGGTVPVIGVHLPGGLAAGLLWLFVLASAGVVVLWILPLLAAAALCRAVNRLVPVRVRAGRTSARRLQARRQAA